MAPATELQDLPDDILSQIALRVSTQERRTLLPVLSRRWAALLQGPGPAWAEVSIYEDAEFWAEALPDFIAIMKWFSRRTGSVRNLKLSRGEAMEYMEGLPACLLATVLMSQAASLRNLRIDYCDPDMLSSEHFAVLVALTALECLSIDVPECFMVDWGVKGAGIIRTLSLLPALTTLVFGCDFTPADAALPSVGHFATLRSPTLTQMGCSVPREGTLALGALPALVSCELNPFFTETENWPAREALHVPLAAFSGATNITRLTLMDFDDLVLAPRCFSCLSMLAVLSLKSCELTEVAAALSGVGRTLRRLDLGDNRLQQLEPSCFSGFSMLEELSLDTCELTEVAAALSGVGRTLRRLDLSGNPELQLVPSCFSGFSMLEELSLQFCGLTEVAAELSGVGRTLRRLDLGDNPGNNHRLQLAPHCFSSFSMLDELSLGDCGLEAVPAALTGVGRTLRQLQLCYNLRLQLTSHCFSSLSMLEELSLQFCGLTAVPAALSGVGRTLRRLDLSGNPALHINGAGSDTLLALPALQSLALWTERCTAGSALPLAHILADWQRRHQGASGSPSGVAASP